MKHLSFTSEYVKNYILDNEVNLVDKYKKTASRGGLGDKAGMPPISNVLLFFELLYEKGDLFLQEDYWNYCLKRWKETSPEWCRMIFTEKYLVDLDDHGRLMKEGDRTEHESSWPVATGLKAKCFRNFYPSFIDTLHVFGLMTESDLFSRIEINTEEDVKSDFDIHATDKHGVECRFAILARKSNSVKQFIRKGSDVKNNIILALPMQRKREGGKRWFEMEDLKKEYSRFQSRIPDILNA